MKNLIKYIILFISISTYGQDKELFGYVNVYRVANHVRAVEWSDKLTEERSSYLINLLITKKQETGDTSYLFHNPKGGWENVALIPKLVSEKGFDVFLDKYYDTPPFNPTTLVDTNKYIKLYLVYMWVLSPKHNKNLLNKSHKYMGADTSIKDVKYQDNKRTMFGKTTTYTTKPFLDMTTYGVINFE